MKSIHREKDHGKSKDSGRKHIDSNNKTEQFTSDDHCFSRF